MARDTRYSDAFNILNSGGAENTNSASYSNITGFEDSKRALGFGRSIYDINAPESKTYGDPLAINSMADLLLNRQGKAELTGGFYIPGVTDLVAATSYLVNSYIKPAVRLDFKTVGFNALNELIEDLDIVANPIKGLVLEGPAGFFRGLGLTKAGRPNYNIDSGDFVVDLVAEVVLDPLNWLSFGAKAGISEIAQAASKGLMDPVALIKAGVDVSDDVAVKTFTEASGIRFSQALARVIKETPVNKIDDMLDTRLKNMLKAAGIDETLEPSIKQAIKNNLDDATRSRLRTLKMAEIIPDKVTELSLRAGLAPITGGLTVIPKDVRAKIFSNVQEFVTRNAINKTQFDMVKFKTTVDDVSESFKQTKERVINENKIVINNEMRNPDGSRRIANITKDGVIEISDDVHVAELIRYLKGEIAVDTSKQRAVVFDVIEKLGYTQAWFEYYLKTPDKVKEFLINLQIARLDHIKGVNYWKNGKDLLTQDKLELEIKAMLDAVHSMGFKQGVHEFIRGTADTNIPFREAASKYIKDIKYKGHYYDKESFNFNNIKEAYHNHPKIVEYLDGSFYRSLTNGLMDLDEDTLFKMVNNRNFGGDRALNKYVVIKNPKLIKDASRLDVLYFYTPKDLKKTIRTYKAYIIPIEEYAELAKILDEARILEHKTFMERLAEATKTISDGRDPRNIFRAEVLNINRSPYFKDMGDYALFNYLKSDKNLYVTYLLKDKNGIPMPKHLRIHTVDDIKRARELNAVILPTTEYYSMFSNINSYVRQRPNLFKDPVLSNKAVEVWLTKIIPTYKTAMLMTTGFIFRNGLDTLVKNAIDAGGIDQLPTAAQYMVKGFKVFDEYSKTAHLIIKNIGGLGPSDIDAVYAAIKSGALEVDFKPLDEDLFKLVHNYINSPGSAGLSKAQSDLYEEIATAKGKTKDPFQDLLYNKNPVTKFINATNNHLEQSARLGMYLKNYEEGLGHNDIMAKIIHSHFDYSTKTKAEQYAEIFFPFVTFPTRNFEYWSDTVFTSPSAAKFFGDLSVASWNIAQVSADQLSEEDKAAGYHASSGNILLGDDVVLKTSPSIMDAFNMLSNPIGTAKERLAPPLKWALNKATGSTERVELIPFKRNVEQIEKNLTQTLPNAVRGQQSPLLLVPSIFSPYYKNTPNKYKQRTAPSYTEQYVYNQTYYGKQ